MNDGPEFWFSFETEENKNGECDSFVVITKRFKRVKLTFNEISKYVGMLKAINKYVSGLF